MIKNHHIEQSRGRFFVHQTDDGEARLEVKLDQETVWLNQRQMAELFDKDTDTVGLHILNLYKEGELTQEATTEESSVVKMMLDDRFEGKFSFTIST